MISRRVKIKKRWRQKHCCHKLLKALRNTRTWMPWKLSNIKRPLLQNKSLKRSLLKMKRPSRPLIMNFQNQWRDPKLISLIKTKLSRRHQKRRRLNLKSKSFSSRLLERRLKRRLEMKRTKLRKPNINKSNLMIKLLLLKKKLLALSNNGVHPTLLEMPNTKLLRKLMVLNLSMKSILKMPTTKLLWKLMV